MIEAALSGNARVQIDISSVHGLGTVRARRHNMGRSACGGSVRHGIVTERPKAAEAARENAGAAQDLIKEMKVQGIDTKDIKTASVTLAPVYDEIRDAREAARDALRESQHLCRGARQKAWAGFGNRRAPAGTRNAFGRGAPAQGRGICGGRCLCRADRAGGGDTPDGGRGDLRNRGVEADHFRFAV
jgi:Protein of unknown function (DUF541)